MQDRGDFSLTGLRELHQLSLLPSGDFNALYAAYLEVGRSLLELSIGIVSCIKDGDYEVLAVQPGDGGISPGDHFPLGDTYCSTVMSKQGSVALHHVGELEEMRSHPVYVGMQLESYIAVPLYVQGEIFGTLNFSDPSPRREAFSIEEMEFLELMGKSLSQTLEQDRLSQQQQAAVSKMEENMALFEGAFRHAAIGMAIVSPQGGWMRVNQALCSILGYDEEALLASDFQTITHPDDLETDLHHVEEMLTGKRSSYWMKKRYIHKNGHIVWVLLAVSLVRNGDGSPRYFLSQIEDITAQVTAELTLREKQGELEELNQELASMARTDPLTGLYNRLVLMEGLRQEFSRCERRSEPMSVIFMDVDHFKQYNDSYGHVEGDAALQAVAEALRPVIRDTDVLARYGGEEFVALLPTANSQDAERVAERCRRAVAEISSLSRPVSLSVGVATLRFGDEADETKSPESLLSAADRALYVAKGAGRNRVHTAQL
ncbi:MAG: diguanylate cyclase [Alcanivorax borkumensis]|uniref:diguanylate cyclase n=2 Tax=Alcanivorax borkumensis TaxID=59754 RepID=Q0VL34_ALCBS|nr:sensor domain-containing diguanylate cyclase [Alcanivorax borkumensis]OJH06545.1 MAG: diguanylate cyclase [Alcanivorax borkumensis]CAL18114.1 GAF/PAS/GGDEF domain protein [Alcanivorax borkumensis SK2]